MAFEKRAVRVPINRAIREDLHSINRVSTPTGQITYRAPHSPDGHADRCTALALALRAGGDSQVRYDIESVPRGASTRGSENARAYYAKKLEREKYRFLNLPPY